MREILFRGKRKDNGKFVCGFLVMNKCSKSEYGRLIYYTRPEIIPIGEIGEADYDGDGNYYEYTVIPETVGQYTGLTDKNGKKIFEGDILRVCRGNDIDTGYVLYDERMASYSISVTKNECLLFIDWFIAKQEDNRVWIEVIGNIHDNPELLKGGVE